ERADIEEQEVGGTHARGVVLLHLPLRQRDVVDRGELDGALPGVLAARGAAENEQRARIPVGQGATGQLVDIDTRRAGAAGSRYAAELSVHVDLASIGRIVGHDHVL